jgi:hypothetical protein
MSNGKIDEAEIDALLTGDQRLVDRYLVTGIRELKTSLGVVKSEVAAMRGVCEQRGSMCPGMHGYLADPVDPAKLRTLAAEKARGVVQVAQGVADETMLTAEGVAAELASNSRKTWAMWGVGTTLLREIALPLVIVVATLYISGRF